MSVAVKGRETVYVGIGSDDTVVCMLENAAYVHARLHRALVARTWGEFSSYGFIDAV